MHIAVAFRITALPFSVLLHPSLTGVALIPDGPWGLARLLGHGGFVEFLCTPLLRKWSH